jgi:hypothetical protein
MTSETIDIYSGIGVTSIAEMFLLIITGISAILLRRNMAIDALRQGVPGGADTFIHGVIALMQDEIHVVFTHLRNRLDAAKFFISFCLCLGYNRRGYFTGIQGQGQQKPCRYYD